MARKELTETYMYFWLQNLVGLTGKFQLAQLINVDYWYEDKMKTKLPLNEKGKVPKMKPEEIEKRLSKKNGR